jgi:hypothetical protein
MNTFAKKILSFLIGMFVASTCYGSFELINKSQNDLTLILDYSYKSSFDVAYVRRNGIIEIDYGLSRIIAYSGDARDSLRVKGVTFTAGEDSISKKQKLPFEGKFIVRYVSGREGSIVQAGSRLPLLSEDMFIKYRTDAARWEIRQPTRESTLAIWRIE